MPFGSTSRRNQVGCAPLDHWTAFDTGQVWSASAAVDGLLHTASFTPTGQCRAGSPHWPVAGHRALRIEAPCGSRPVGPIPGRRTPTIGSTVLNPTIVIPGRSHGLGSDSSRLRRRCNRVVQVKLAVIGDTQHYRDSQGRLCALEPVVNQLDRWAQLFDEVVMNAPLDAGPPPPGFAPYSALNVTIEPLPRAGGNTLESNWPSYDSSSHGRSRSDVSPAPWMLFTSDARATSVSSQSLPLVVRSSFDTRCTQECGGDDGEPFFWASAAPACQSPFWRPCQRLRWEGTRSAPIWSRSSARLTLGVLADGSQ